MASAICEVGAPLDEPSAEVKLKSKLRYISAEAREKKCLETRKRERRSVGDTYKTCENFSSFKKHQALHFGIFPFEFQAVGPQMQSCILGNLSR